MHKLTTAQTCTCPCSASKIQVANKPLTRFVCHCTTCQQVFKRPCADVMVYWARDLKPAPDHAIQFKTYAKPPAVNRGLCSVCGSPVVGLLPLTPFVRLAFVTSANYPDLAAMPGSQAHIFYHSQTTDIYNDVPKYTGYLPSKLAVATLLMRAMLHRVACGRSEPVAD